MAEKGEKERDHAEIPAIDADRFLIAFNAATGASVAIECRWQLAVMNVDHGQFIRCWLLRLAFPAGSTDHSLFASGPSMPSQFSGNA